MPDIHHSPKWYALRTKSRQEKLVRDRLASHGIEQLLPTIRRLNQWKDRKKEGAQSKGLYFLVTALYDLLCRKKYPF